MCATLAPYYYTEKKVEKSAFYLLEENRNCIILQMKAISELSGCMYFICKSTDNVNKNVVNKESLFYKV